MIFRGFPRFAMSSCATVNTTRTVGGCKREACIVRDRWTTGGALEAGDDDARECTKMHNSAKHARRFDRLILGAVDGSPTGSHALDAEIGCRVEQDDWWHARRTKQSQSKPSYVARKAPPGLGINVFVQRERSAGDETKPMDRTGRRGGAVSEGCTIPDDPL